MPYLADTLALSESAFVLLRDLIHARTGVFYENGRHAVLLDKLSPLVAERRLDSFLDYYYLLKYDAEGAEEWRRVESALAVGETYFWREADQLKAAAEVLVPQWQRERPGQPVRIWHAGCATGEEPYSLVMALMEAGRFLYGPIEIVATDANQKALAQARAGVYGERSFRALPLELKARYFVPAEANQHQLRAPVAARVRFEYLNLVQTEQMQRMRGFDLIFCRNVFIYFSDQAIRRVTEHFCQALNPSGCVCVGAAESLLKVTTELELTEIGGAFVYRK